MATRKAGECEFERDGSADEPAAGDYDVEVFVIFLCRAFGMRLRE